MKDVLRKYPKIDINLSKSHRMKWLRLYKILPFLAMMSGHCFRINYVQLLNLIRPFTMVLPTLKIQKFLHK